MRGRACAASRSKECWRDQSWGTRRALTLSRATAFSARVFDLESVNASSPNHGRSSKGLYDTTNRLTPLASDCARGAAHASASSTTVVSDDERVMTVVSGVSE